MRARAHARAHAHTHMHAGARPVGPGMAAPATAGGGAWVRKARIQTHARAHTRTLAHFPTLDTHSRAASRPHVVCAAHRPHLVVCHRENMHLWRSVAEEWSTGTCDTDTDADADSEAAAPGARGAGGGAAVAAAVSGGWGGLRVCLYDDPGVSEACLGWHARMVQVRWARIASAWGFDTLRVNL